MNHQAIYELYPQVVTIDDGAGAFDQDGNQVEIDQSAVEDKSIKLKAIENAKQEAEMVAKESALFKLTKLGLSTDEVKALLGVK
jgi:plasmid maintenance system killer protein